MRKASLLLVWQRVSGNGAIGKDPEKGVGYFVSVEEIRVSLTPINDHAASGTGRKQSNENRQV